VREEDFNTKRFTSALRYLHDDFPKIIERLKTEDLWGTESTYGYPNSLIQVEGYVLLQEALLRRNEHELARERGRRGRATKTDVAAAAVRAQQATRAFCDFLRRTHDVD
jgi:hypothetical protein